ncbi:F-box domain-containing protein [Mycena venus]|uniref:F-box domain-containing protein n=1 Tax=Mycena venus TaxID=2733690 RepID=A0A8H7D893_9AGAR|nr:F-box domain-containing protein [Mycena venus]
MAPALHNLPPDIILEVVNFLQMPDPISLLLTCSSLYNFANQRSFWILVLETTRRKTPIACPFYADLSQYTLETLKSLVVSCLKLHGPRVNWNQPFPQLAQPMISARLPGLAEIIFHVQGTDILVLHTGGRVCCWDLKLATPFPFPAIEISGRVTGGISPPMEAPGICALPFLTEQAIAPYTTYRYVLTIKHEDGKVIDLGHEFCEVLVPDGPHYESLFLTEDLVGFIVTENGQDNSIITVSAVNCDDCLRDSVSLLKLHRFLATNNELMMSFLFKGHLYVVLEDEAHGEDEDNSTPGIISFTFLTCTLTHAFDDGVSSPLAFDSPCVTEYVRGRLVDDTNLVWMDHAGLNVITVVVYDDIPRLVVVRYHPDMKYTTIHYLNTPDTINLGNLEAVWIDGAAGTVYLADKQDLLFTLRYI